MLADILQVEAELCDFAHNFIYLVFHVALGNPHAIDEKGIVNLLLSDALIVPSKLFVVDRGDVAAGFKAFHLFLPPLAFVLLLRDLLLLITNRLLEGLH